MWMDVCINCVAYGWMDGWMDIWLMCGSWDECMNGRVDGWMNVYMC